MICTPAELLESDQLQHPMDTLAGRQGEPVQYVLGEREFLDKRLQPQQYQQLLQPAVEFGEHQEFDYQLYPAFPRQPMEPEPECGGNTAHQGLDPLAHAARIEREYEPRVSLQAQEARWKGEMVRENQYELFG